MLNLMSVLNEALLFIVEIYTISYGHRRPLNNVNSWMILGFSVLYSKECCCGFFFLHLPFGLLPATRESSTFVAVQIEICIFTLVFRRLGNNIKQR